MNKNVIKNVSLAIFMKKGFKGTIKIKEEKNDHKLSWVKQSKNKMKMKLN